MLVADPVTIGGVVGFLNGVARLGEHPLIAYALVVLMIFADVVVAGLINTQGVIGFLIQQTFFLLSGVVIPVYSLYILIIFVTYPVVRYCLLN